MPSVLARLLLLALPLRQELARQLLARPLPPAGWRWNVSRTSAHQLISHRAQLERYAAGEVARLLSAPLAPLLAQGVRDRADRDHADEDEPDEEHARDDIAALGGGVGEREHGVNLPQPTLVRGERGVDCAVAGCGSREDKQRLRVARAERGARLVEAPRAEQGCGRGPGGAVAFALLGPELRAEGDQLGKVVHARGARNRRDPHEPVRVEVVAEQQHGRPLGRCKSREPP